MGASLELRAQVFCSCSNQQENASKNRSNPAIPTTPLLQAGEPETSWIDRTGQHVSADMVVADPGWDSRVILQFTLSVAELHPKDMAPDDWR